MTYYKVAVTLDLYLDGPFDNQTACKQAQRYISISFYESPVHASTPNAEVISMTEYRELWAEQQGYSSYESYLEDGNEPLEED